MVQLTSGNAILQQRGSAMSDCHTDTTGVPSYHCTFFVISMWVFLYIFGVKWTIVFSIHLGLVRCE